jgi:hypothetical protein
MKILQVFSTREQLEAYMTGNDNVGEQNVNNQTPSHSVYLIVLALKLYKIKVLQFTTQSR